MKYYDAIDAYTKLLDNFKSV